MRAEHSLHSLFRQKPRVALGKSVFVDVAMGLFHREARPVHAFLYLVCNQHRSVPPARATERDREIALSFANIMRNEIDEQIGNPIDEFHRLRK